MGRKAPTGLFRTIATKPDGGEHFYPSRVFSTHCVSTGTQARRRRGQDLEPVRSTAGAIRSTEQRFSVDLSLSEPLASTGARWPAGEHVHRPPRRARRPAGEHVPWPPRRARWPAGERIHMVPPLRGSGRRGEWTRPCATTRIRPPFRPPPSSRGLSWSNFGLAMIMTGYRKFDARFQRSRTKFEQRTTGDARNLVVAAIVSAAVGLFGIRQRATFLEQDPEVERTRGITALIRATICRLGRSRSATLLE